MKKKIRNTIIVLALSPFVMQCASMSDVEDIRRQLTAVNKKIELVKSNTVGEMQKRQAAAFSQMDQFEQQMLELRSQLDESYQLNQRLREQNKELQLSINSVAENEARQRQQALQQIQQQNQEKEQTIAQLNQQLLLQQQSLDNIKQARLADAKRKAEKAARDAEAARRTALAVRTTSAGSSTRHITATKKKVKKDVIAPARPVAAPARPVSQPTVSSPKAPVVNVQPQSQASTGSSESGQFHRAKQLADQNKCKQAIPILENIRKDRRSANAVDATFLIAECYLKKGQLYEALPEYQRIIAQYPQDNRVPDAMLRLAGSFEKVRDFPTAKAIYKKLIRKYGSAPEAAKAQARLDTL